MLLLFNFSKLIGTGVATISETGGANIGVGIVFVFILTYFVYRQFNFLKNYYLIIKNINLVVNALMLIIGFCPNYYSFLPNLVPGFYINEIQPLSSEENVNTFSAYLKIGSVVFLLLITTFLLKSTLLNGVPDVLPLPDIHPNLHDDDEISRVELEACLQEYVNGRLEDAPYNGYGRPNR